jgi:pilus assembly protein Flp/PilA
MKTIVRKLNALALVRDTRGANMVEYIAILGLVAIAAITAFTSFGSAVTGEVGKASTKVGTLVK